ncbi:MAG TPA: methylmalonyl-CoA epimerase [Acidilobales archaeon]|nr:MAG: methylmalonyl-CoA epimerase [Thermoprotei archaeon]HDD26258.1 methylmalonyl-CoA epimerase [Acidilobales archaeon]
MVKYLKVDHIGIAVKSLDEAVKFYRDVLGLELVTIEEVSQEHVKVAMFKVGETYIELVQPTSPESAVAKFIEKRGEGVHHIALGVEDVKGAIEELASKGVKMIYTEPKLVAGGKRLITFLHPKQAHGVLIELVRRLEGEK